MAGVRYEVARWLRGRLLEIEETALARAYAIADPAETEDFQYVAGLRAAISAGIEFGLAGIEQGEDRAGPVPDPLLTQARHAARSGVDLDVVLRRCFAGYALLGDFVLLAIERGDLAPSPQDLRSFWATQTSLLDRLVTEMADVYKRDTADRLGHASSRRLGHVERLLAGQLLDSRELSYELHAWHIGVVAVGPGADAVIRDLATALDRRLLLVAPVGETVWAWLGGSQEVPGSKVLNLASASCVPDVAIALGESAFGTGGWRRTHRQAKAAIPIALNRPPSAVRYADVSLLASALRDDLLADSLATAYLEPLAQERDGGAAVRLTLRAYLAAGLNASSAAAALKVSRQTVNSRLRIVEERIGCPIGDCTAELETALRLRELRRAGPRHGLGVP